MWDSGQDVYFSIGEKAPNYLGLWLRYQTQLKRPQGEP